MRPTDSDHESTLSATHDSASEAGPLPSSFGRGGSSNGHANGNGALATNRTSSVTNGVQKNGKIVARVFPPGTTLYNDTTIDREEFVRLVIQSLRDVGYRCVTRTPLNKLD